jgi:hypothetical protein
MSIKGCAMALVVTFALRLFSAYGQNPQNSLCGVQLRTAAVRQLLQELDNHYGKPVKCQLDPRLHEIRSDWARHDVLQDGSKLGEPTITLDEKLSASEDEIAHELLHLQIQAKVGYQRFGVRPWDLPSSIDRNNFVYVAGNLLDALDHFVMYPKLRKMGFDPDKKERDSLLSRMAKTGRPFGEETSLASRALWYAESATTFNDQELITRLEDSMERAGWHDSLMLGRELRDSIKKAELTTLSGIGAEEVAGLKILYGSKLHVKWEYDGTNVYLVAAP